MREDIIKDLQQEIYKRCQMETNLFGMGCYYHIAAVAKNAELLADEYKADREVVTIAAWLHDVASITDYSLYEQHHIHGARMAGDMLTGYGYDTEKLRLVQACIRNHRGSVSLERISPEELCVADADSLSHFDNVPGLLYLAYAQKGLGIDEGREFVKGKLKRSFQKLSLKGQKHCLEKFQTVMEVLG